MRDPNVAVVVEDDDDVRNLLVAVLQQAGFEVHAAATGHQGVDAVRAHHASLVTLDVGLPDIDGFEVLRRVRQFSDAYVVMLTGRNDELDTITALHGGADDYMTKPFRSRELRARVVAMMRRPRREISGWPEPDTLMLHHSPEPRRTVTAQRSKILQHNGLTLQVDSRTATLRGKHVAFTRSEFDLLHDLFRAGGAVRTRAELVRVVRGEQDGEESYISEADQRAVEVHLGNIRRKLGDDPVNPQWLITVRGVGYRLAPARGE
ncbi:response regulator transcription factor [Arthrobacter sp. MPF02]|uniref:response regulator transcription factor n=1 Tax=Arthrobacter sp. MPF02 TaxID=3388492 RepID=UPI0039851AFE